jgi:gamma-glutamylcysteine synthetase
LAAQYREFYANHPLRTETQQQLEQIALHSLAQQQQLEAQPQPDFSEYLRPYRTLVENI